MMQNNLVLLTQWLDIAGATLLVIGFVIASVRFIAAYFRQGADDAITSYRKALGRVVLIGLEVLVASTIIKTITHADTMGNLALLAGMIVIRTALGWTTVLETSGHWPWQTTNTQSSQE